MDKNKEPLPADQHLVMDDEVLLLVTTNRENRLRLTVDVDPLVPYGVSRDRYFLEYN